VTEREGDFALPRGLKRKDGREMRRTWITLAALAMTLAGRVPLAQAQDNTTQNGITMGGHIGFVLPLVTHSGGQTINDTADQFSIGFPVGVTFN
jgi:hypothetical protein